MCRLFLMGPVPCFGALPTLRRTMVDCLLENVFKTSCLVGDNLDSSQCMVSPPTPHHHHHPVSIRGTKSTAPTP